MRTVCKGGSIQGECLVSPVRRPGSPVHTPSSTSNAQQNLSLSINTIPFPSGAHRTSLVSYFAKPSCSPQLPPRVRLLTARRHADALCHILVISPLSHPLVAPNKDTLSATADYETAFAHRVPPCVHHRLPMHQHTPQTWDEWLRRRWKVVDMHPIRYILCPRI